MNFALYSKHASTVFLLLFDSPDGEPTDVIQLRHRDKLTWHVHVQGIGPGQLYGYKVRGEYRPEFGLRFNDAKLLLDPYAKAVTGKFFNTQNLLLAYDAQPGAGERSPDTRDNTSIVPKAIVVDDAFDWQGDTSPDLSAVSDSDPKRHCSRQRAPAVRRPRGDPAGVAVRRVRGPSVSDSAARAPGHRSPAPPFERDRGSTRANRNRRNGTAACLSRLSASSPTRCASGSGGGLLNGTWGSGWMTTPW